MASSTPIQDAVPFLTDAAHLLRVSAPETSAYLMQHCTSLLQYTATPLPDTLHQHSCGSCGQIMIPGNDASAIRLQRADRRRKRPRPKPPAMATKGDSSASSPAPLQKQICCGRCKRTNTIKLENPPKAARLSRTKAKTTVEPAPSVVGEGEGASLKNKSNANSKKRAKNRKAGLQSLLAAGQTQKGKSLSLSDFMR